MSETFYFYDLETSGLDPRKHRIMQFAGQRATLDLQPIGQPTSVLVKLADDVLPAPQAILTTSITPQQTLADGISEVDLVRLLMNDVLTPGTIMVGFNNIRFDDNFIRFLLYRSFYDAYEWAWKDARSRWDLLDVARMTCALRPDGINWPVDEDGRAIFTLEALARANDIQHDEAHSALGDVNALIAFAKLMMEKQPRLFDYLLQLRTKAKVAQVIKPSSPVPFVYTTRMYGKQHLFTSVAEIISTGQRKDSYIVFDLRIDPSPFLNMTTEQLNKNIFAKREELDANGQARVPVKELALNKCPAVAPISVMDSMISERLSLDIDQIEQYRQLLRSSDFGARISAAYDYDGHEFISPNDVDADLYGGFISDNSATTVRAASHEQLVSLAPNFTDPRLPELFIRYKARNYPDTLSTQEREIWETYRSKRILNDTEEFNLEVERIWTEGQPKARHLMEDLQLWYESIYPAEAAY